MSHIKGLTLEARKIIRQGNAKPLFWSITEPCWVEVRLSNITNNMANYIFQEVSVKQIE